MNQACNTYPPFAEICRRIKAHVLQINGHKMFKINRSRQLVDMVPKQAHQWTTEEGVPDRLLQTTLTPVEISHICHACLKFLAILKEDNPNNIC